MPIQITDFHVDILRGFLKDEHERIRPMLELVRVDEAEGLSVLMYAAFVEAVHRRFTGSARSDIIRFVADIRMRHEADPVPEDLVTLAGGVLVPVKQASAEKLIIAALSGTHPEGLTALEKGQRIPLLADLIEEAQRSNEALESFLAAARNYAEQIAGSLPSPPGEGRV